MFRVPSTASHAAVSVEPLAINTQNWASLSIRSFFDNKFNTSHQSGVLQRPIELANGLRDNTAGQKETKVGDLAKNSASRGKRGIGT